MVILICKLILFVSKELASLYDQSENRMIVHVKLDVQFI